MYLKLTMNIIINFLVLLYPSWWKRYIWHFIHGLWGREDNILYINKIFLNIFEHVTSPVSIYIVGYEEFLTNVISTVSSDFFFFFFFFFFFLSIFFFFYYYYQFFYFYYDEFIFILFLWLLSFLFYFYYYYQFFYFDFDYY